MGPVAGASHAVSLGQTMEESQVGMRFRASFLGPRHWFGWLMIGLIALGLLLPRPLILLFGRGLGRLFHSRNRKRVHIAQVNLQLCFPALSEERRMRLLKEHLARYGQAIMDLGLVWWASERRLDRLCTVSGEQGLRALHQAGRPVLLVTPHTVGIDMSGAILSRLLPGVSMMKRASDPLLSWCLWRGRIRFGAQILMRDQGLRPFLRALKSGRVGYFMPDEDLGPAQSVFAPFFGVATATLPIVGRLAQLTGAAVVPVFTCLANSGHYHVSIGEALTDFPTGDQIADTTRVNAAFEALVRGAPEQYLWTLKWFRTRPSGESPPYD